MEHYFICYTQLAKLDCSSSLVLFTITFLILYLDSGKSHLVWNVDTYLAPLNDIVVGTTTVC